MIETSPIYIAYYTRGTLYEQEAARLRASLDALHLPHDIVGVESAGDWKANTGLCASFCVKMLAKHFTRPVVLLDADAVVRKTPELFYQLDGYDIAAHWVNGSVFANGTVYWGMGETSASIARRYEQLVIGYGGRHPDEQTLLRQAIEEHDRARVYRLPAAYCWINDICLDGLADDEIVIEHLQASREQHAAGPHLDNRHKRIEYLTHAV